MRSSISQPTPTTWLCKACLRRFASRASATAHADRAGQCKTDEELHRAGMEVRAGAWKHRRT